MTEDTRSWTEKGEMRPEAPLFAFSIKDCGNLLACVLIVTLAVGFCMRFVMVTAQPKPNWNIGGCEAGQPIEVNGTLYTKIDCGSGHTVVYSLLELSTKGLDVLMLTGRTAHCWERPAIATLLGKVDTTCVVEPAPTPEAK